MSGGLGGSPSRIVREKASPPPHQVSAASAAPRRSEIRPCVTFKFAEARLTALHAGLVGVRFHFSIYLRRIGV